MDFGFGAEPEGDDSAEYNELTQRQNSLLRLIELTKQPEWELLAEMCRWNVDNKLRSLLRVDTLERLADLRGEIRALEWVVDLPRSLGAEYQGVTDKLVQLTSEEGEG